jgi:hypothetical protein
MKEEPEVVAEDRFKHLSKLQNTTRIVALILAFAGVFFWFVKILFL